MGFANLSPSPQPHTLGIHIVGYHGYAVKSLPTLTSPSNATMVSSTMLLEMRN